MPSPKPRRPTTIPDWWKQLTPAAKQAYLAKHPRSRFKNAEVGQLAATLSPQQKQRTVKWFKGLAGPRGKLTDALARVNPKKWLPARKAAIADDLKAAHEAAKNGDQKTAQKRGYSATAKTMATAGLLVVGSAALIAAGVPVGCFTPDLVHEVWHKVNPAAMSAPRGSARRSTSDDNDEITASLLDAIRDQLKAGVDPKSLRDSMLANVQPPKGGDFDNTDSGGGAPKDQPPTKPKRPAKPKSAA